jgi:hypothetical protein
MNTQELYDYIHKTYKYQDGHFYYAINVGTKIKAGAKAGSKDRKGYCSISILGKYYKLHHLVYLYHTQRLPTLIDHIDRNVLNNSIENLREVTHSENNHNRARFKKNKSGYKGVYKKGKKWAAEICVNNTVVRLGSHSTPELAYEAYCNYAKNNLTVYYLEN